MRVFDPSDECIKGLKRHVRNDVEGLITNMKYSQTIHAKQNPEGVSADYIPIA